MSSAQALVYQLVTSNGPVALRVRCDLRPSERRYVSLAIPSLDAFLGGGFPCGVITEIFGGLSSGKTTLAHALIGATLRAGELAAWVDLPNCFQPERRSDRILWISPHDCVTALRAAEHVLEAGGFRVVILDLGLPLPAGPAVSASRWLRMARIAARQDAVILVLSAGHVAGAFAALSVEACARRRMFAGSLDPCPVFEGVASSLHVRRQKSGAGTATSIEMYAGIEV